MVKLIITTSNNKISEKILTKLRELEEFDQLFISVISSNFNKIEPKSSTENRDDIPTISWNN